MKREKRQALIQGIRSMDDVGLLVVGAMDEAACFTLSKDRIRGSWNVGFGNEEILIVKQEIEAWYLATVDGTESRSLGFDHPGDTDNITKERLERIRPRRFGSRLDFMLALLDRASIQTGRQQNASLAYFLGRHPRRPGA